MQKNTQNFGDSHTTKPTSLKNALLEIKDSSKHSTITLGSLIHQLGSKGFGVLLAILALPSALPIPAPGYSTPFGIAISLVALQIFAGRKTVWLPKQLHSIQFGQKLTNKMLTVATNFLNKIEKLIRPRYRFFKNVWIMRVIALQIVLLALLMVLPIPMTNTIPAMIIFLTAIGISENDGLICIISSLLSIIAIIFYLILLFILSKVGSEAIQFFL